MVNRVVLVGRLTKDVESRFTPNGKATCSFTLAVDRKFKNAQGEKETDFITCCVPPYKDKLAELCGKFLSKGKLASVDGQLHIRTYNDNAGQKHWVTEINCEDVGFLSPKDDNAGAPAQNPPAQQQPQSQQQYTQRPPQAPYSLPAGSPNQFQGQPPGYGQTQGYGQPPQGQWQGQPPGQQPPPPVWGQTPHPNMPNPNFQQNPPGAPTIGQYGHQVNMNSDEIPF